jgi:hypothetical protein
MAVDRMCPTTRARCSAPGEAMSWLAWCAALTARIRVSWLAVWVRSHRLVLTSWQPRTPEDARLPSRLRIDWTTALRSVGLVDVRVESRAEWHDLFTRVYRVALDLGGPGEDVALARLQDEARRHPIAELVDRVVVTATRSDGGVAAGPAGSVGDDQAT